MYFTIENQWSTIRSERGTTLPGKGHTQKEAVLMLKKLLDFIEEYYEEFSHSEKW